MFSPASAVEGYTTNNPITNVPYLKTHAGYGATNHYLATQGAYPTGINSKIWGGPTYYEWAFLDQYNMLTATGFLYGSGTITGATNLIGTQNGNYAIISGLRNGDGGNINGGLQTPNGGQIIRGGGDVSVYAYKGAGSPNCLLMVYGSNDSSSWQQIGTTKYISNTSPQWIRIGQRLEGLKYVAVVAYSTGASMTLNIDAIYIG
jgi:hypothetical protein